MHINYEAKKWINCLTEKLLLVVFVQSISGYGGVQMDQSLLTLVLGFVELKRRLFVRCIS